MSVDAICALFGKTRQAYYQRLGYQYQEAAEESIILDLIAELRKDMGRMGGRKLWHEINEAHPKMISRDKLFDILDKYHLKVHRRKRTVRTTWSESWLHRFPNLVKDLLLTAANQVWVSDITYIETETGFVYLHLVTDAYSKKIMGWCLSPSLHADATISALQMAIRNAGCDLKGLIHHSDRGCQYCCEKYVKLLQNNGIEISMTQDGDPRDNAIAERLNGILKTEWLYDDHFIGFDDAYRRVAEVINLYNNKRPHLSLNYKTPAEAHLETGEQKRVWKNYYKGNNPEEVAKVISDLTSGCRISAAY
ncbi:MAG: IS3 family transposase [Bacteroidales bacterium]|uniref:IS3 family transposase n=1 Tax=Candidatus Cryptobacteroides sp. TaxID=2952915 RepID=UPI002A7568F6|nr:IS3 family transposase [Candidatus Cryptobacteroides sp.]MCI6327745.1 IS3 family transposase [Bacteroidales bacterium]MDD7234216.1 IS3 family transposase [Bacteroidales bacterium]MDY2701219.1 IS3 family transposase [Candidatus Cryptobacteroides sp.]